MSEINSKSASSSDEVDLVFVLVKTIGFLAKTWWYFVLASVIGLGIGLTVFYLSPKIYQSKFTAECMALPDSRVVDIVNDLKKLAEIRDTEQLAQKLNVSEDIATKITTIEPLSTIKIDKEAIGVDEYLLPSYRSYVFSIVVQVKDNSILPILQKGLIRYISDNEYSQIRVRQFKESKYQLVSVLDDQMLKLDSANSLYEAKLIRKEGPNITLAHPGDFRMLLIQLEEKKQDILNEIELAQAVRVIQNFTAFKKPVAPKRLGMVIQYVALCNVLLLLGLLGRELASIYARNKN